MKLKSFSNALQKLRCIEQKLIKEFEKGTGFSLTRYEILIYLSEKEHSPQTDIAYHIGIDPAAVTRQLKVLEKEGFVKRERNIKNAREVMVTLTNFAKKELLNCKKKQKEKECNLPVPFAQEEIDELLNILEKIEKKL